MKSPMQELLYQLRKERTDSLKNKGLEVFIKIVGGAVRIIFKDLIFNVCSHFICGFFNKFVFKILRISVSLNR